MLNDEILQAAKDLNDELVQIRRTLHQNPETSFDLPKTLKLVKEKLISYGYDPKPCGKAGLTCTIGNKGKVFLLRADMDALNIIEDNDLSYKSCNNKMHACGHDMHTTMLLGAAKILKKYENQLNGTIKFMFQPSEETFEGSKDMIEDHILENPKVDGAMMMHVMTNAPLPTGSVFIMDKGVSAPAADYFTIEVKGKACHGSSPWLGIDPMIASANIILALQEITTREISSNDPSVFTIGTIESNNKAANAISDMVTLKGTIRTFDEKIRAYIKERIEQIAKSIAAAYRCNADVYYPSGAPTLLNDEDLSLKLEKYMIELLGENKAIPMRKMKQSGGVGGSEDFAYVSQQVPSIMLAICAGMASDGHQYPVHNPKATFDEDVLWQGAAIFSYAAINYLNDAN